MLSVPAFDRLLLSFARAAAQDLAWREALANVASAFGADGARLGGAGAFSVHVGQIPDGWRHHGALATTEAALRLQPDARVLSGCAPGALAGEVEQLAIARGPDRPAFTQEDAVDAARVAVHLSLARRAWGRLALAGLGRDALDALGDAVLLVDPACRILFSNTRADALLSEGAVLVRRSDRLRTTTAAAQARLSQLLRTTGEPGGRRAAARLPDARGASELVLIAIPLPAGASRPRCLLLAAISVDAGATEPERVAALFGMTPAEAAVACRVGAGAGLPAAAAELGVARTTARTHLVRVFDKAGVHSQAELARRMGRIAPFLAGDAPPRTAGAGAAPHPFV